MRTCARSVGELMETTQRTMEAMMDMEASANKPPSAIFLEREIRSLRRVKRGIAMTVISVTTERTQKTILAVLEADAQMDAMINLDKGDILNMTGLKFTWMGRQ